MTAEVCFGLTDWGESISGLYPEDLPVEWREAYYATQFSCVWFSQETSSSITPEMAARWLTDVPESFRFLFESGSVMPVELLNRAVTMPTGLIWFDAGTSLSVLSDLLVRAAAGTDEVFILSRDGNLAQIEQVRTLKQLLGL